MRKYVSLDSEIFTTFTKRGFVIDEYTVNKCKVWTIKAHKKGGRE